MDPISPVPIPAHPVRFVTAASLFDGHDAAIQEDVHGIAVSSYQGGQVEYYGYLVDLLRERGAGHLLRERGAGHLLRERGAGHVQIFGGGGGGMIVPDEIAALQARGVAQILLPRGRPAARPARHGQLDDHSLRRQPHRRGAVGRGGGRRSGPGPRPGALPGGDRRDGARLSRGHRTAR